MKRSLLVLSLLTAVALAQSTVTKLEIQDVEVTVPTSPTSNPFFPLDYAGEIEVPLIASDADGKGVAGVKVEWTVQNSGKNPVYIIRAWDAGSLKRLRLTIKAGEKTSLETNTDSDGLTKIMMNATEAGQAKIAAKSGTLNALNLRGVAHQIDWIK